MYTDFDQLVLEKIETFLDESNPGSGDTMVFVEGNLDEQWLEYGVEMDEEVKTVESYEDLSHLNSAQINELYDAVITAFEDGFDSYRDDFEQ